MPPPKAATTRPAFDNRGKKDHIVATMVPLRRLIHSVPLQRAIKHYVDVFSKVVQNGWLVLAAVVLRSCLSENALPSLRKRHAHDASTIVTSALFVGTQPHLNRDLRIINGAVLAVWQSEFSDKGWEMSYARSSRRFLSPLSLFQIRLLFAENSLAARDENHIGLRSSRNADQPRPPLFVAFSWSHAQVFAGVVK